MIDGVLHKKWISPNLQRCHFQVIVPPQKVREILEEAHISGGHFGINKTLKKIRKRFYWATCKKAPKLQSPWEGPWVVVEKLSDVVYSKISTS